MPASLPTPSQLFRRFACGELTREQLHAAMAEHATLLIEEMEDDHRNPVAAYFERLRNKRAAARLLRRHPEAVLRAAFSALGELPDFPPARLLWNAWHWDVPLHCFIRTRRDPVFRILRFEAKRMAASIVVEYGAPGSGETAREGISLERDWQGKMTATERRRIR